MQLIDQSLNEAKEKYRRFRFEFILGKGVLKISQAHEKTLQDSEYFLKTLRKYADPLMQRLYYDCFLHVYLLTDDEFSSMESAMEFSHIMTSDIITWLTDVICKSSIDKQPDEIDDMIVSLISFPYEIPKNINESFVSAGDVTCIPYVELECIDNMLNADEIDMETAAYLIHTKAETLKSLLEEYTVLRADGCFAPEQRECERYFSDKEANRSIRVPQRYERAETGQKSHVDSRKIPGARKFAYLRIALRERYITE